MSLPPVTQIHPIASSALMNDLEPGEYPSHQVDEVEEALALHEAASQAMEMIGGPGGLMVLARASSEEGRTAATVGSSGALGPSSASVIDPSVHADHILPVECEEDINLCVICLHDCQPSHPIFTCQTCYLVVHLACMEEWLRGSGRNGAGRCPGCQQVTNWNEFQLDYTCWCKRIIWSDKHREMEGIRPAHSCGLPCGRLRPNGCQHRCEQVCHRGRCQPCGHQREGVSCLGGHQIFAPFPCGSETPKCEQLCGQLMPCGHECQAVCHSGAHAPCTVQVTKACGCGAENAIPVPCSQQVVQCPTLCQKLLGCGQHPCQMRCHPGDCSERKIASAWNKNSWVKIGAPIAAAAAAPRPSPPSVQLIRTNSHEFPSLGGAPVISTPQPLPSSPSFQSCGKVCARMRSCGHNCTQICHSLAPVNPSPSGSNLMPSASLSAASSSSTSSSCGSSSTTSMNACDQTRCTQTVTVSCPCGRKSDKLRCWEQSQPENIKKFQCDTTCNLYLDGRIFFQKLDRVKPEVKGGEQVILLPFSQSLLALLSNPSSIESNFYRKLEEKVVKFCLGLAAGNTSTANLYLTGLSASRRLLISQLALWTNLNFNQLSGYLERVDSQHYTELQLLNSQPLSRMDSYAQIPIARQSSSEPQESKEEINTEFEESSLIDNIQPDLLVHTDDELIIPASSQSLVLPSMSAFTAASIYADTITKSSVCTAETWPTSLVIKLTFPSSDSGTEETLERAPILRRCFGLYRHVSRIILTSSKNVLILFASPILARRAYNYVKEEHSSELDSHHITIEPPQRTAAAQLEIDADEAIQEELKRQTLETRQKSEEDYDAIKLKAAKNKPRDISSSIITPDLASSTLSLFPSELVGHSKLKLSSKNVFDMLMEEEE